MKGIKPILETIKLKFHSCKNNSTDETITTKTTWSTGFSIGISTISTCGVCGEHWDKYA